MAKYEEVIKLVKKNNGIVTTALVQEKGIARQYLKNMVDSGKLTKVARGVYVLPEVWDDEFFNLHSQFKKGIFSNETALFLQDLTDRAPISYSMCFPNNYNLTKVKNNGVLASRAKEPIYSLGIVEVRTPSNNIVWAYNVEKTLCDILRTPNHVEAGVIAEA
ncbi:MAG: type IV toxin-antitoxin system AbiEi family antitoxin domain-containing protein, partial [Bacilli bacterium]